MNGEGGNHSILSEVTQAQKDSHIFSLICGSQLLIIYCVCLIWSNREAWKLQAGHWGHVHQGDLGGRKRKVKGFLLGGERLKNRGSR